MSQYRVDTVDSIRHGDQMFLAHYRSQRANRTNESPVAPIREFESAFNANLKGGDKMSREDLSFDEVENEIFEYGASHAGDDEPPDIGDITRDLFYGDEEDE